MTDEKKPTVFAKAKAYIFDKRIDKYLQLSGDILDVSFKLGGAVKNPLMLIPATGAILGAARRMFVDQKSEVKNFIARKDLVDSKSDFGQLVYGSGINDLFELNQDAAEEGTSVMRIDVDDKTSLWLICADYGTPKLYTKREEIKTAVNKLINSVFDKIGGVGIEITRSEGFSESSGSQSIGMKKIPQQFCDHEIDLQIKFANMITSHYRTKESPAFILHGPPGTGKTTLCLAVAQLMGLKVIMIGPQALHSLNARTLFELISALRPGMLIIDDVDKAGHQSMFYTALNSIRTSYPEMAIALTANSLYELGPAILRPGRGGEIWFFEPPSLERKVEIFKDNCRFKDLDAVALMKAVEPSMTHDWVRNCGAKISRRQTCTQAEALEIVRNISLNFKVVKYLAITDEDKTKVEAKPETKSTTSKTKDQKRKPNPKSKK